MGATFNRIKSWIAETLTASDINAEFNNILNNFTPAGMDDYSASVAEMQTQTDPGEVGSESQATSLSEEIERLRYTINEIKGSTYWYTSPVTSLASLNTAFGNGGLPPSRLVSGASSANSGQSLILTPEGAGVGNDVTIEGTATTLTYYVDNAEYTLGTDAVIASTTAPPTSNNTATINDAMFAGQDWTKYSGLYGGALPIDNIGSEITSLNGKRAAFKLVNAGTETEYFLATPDTTNNQLKDVYRGWFFDESNAAIPAVTITDADTLTLMNIAYVFLNTGGTAAATYNEPTIGPTQPSTPTIGDYWYDTANETWKTYNGSSFAAANSVYVGIAIIDENGDCVAARSEDFTQSYLSVNTSQLDYESATEVKSNKGARIGVYGTVLDFRLSDITWDITTDLDTGTEAASTMYFCYLTETGVPKLSIQAPIDMAHTRGGYYHPHETWRCLGQAWNDASSDLGKVLSYHTDDVGKAMASSSVSANALTLEYWASPLMKHRINTSNDDTAITIDEYVFPIYQSITVPSGATLGHTNRLAAASTAFANPDNVILHMVMNNDMPTLGVAAHQFGQQFLKTTLAMGTASDTGTLYTSEAYTSAPCRAIAWGKSLQATAGTWALNLRNFTASPDINACRVLRTDSSGAYSNSSGTEGIITNLTASYFFTKERRLRFRLTSATTSSTTSASNIEITDAGAGAYCSIRLFIDGTAYRSIGFTTAASETGFPASSFDVIIDPEEISAAGNYTMNVRALNTASDTIEVENCSLVIEELPYEGTW